MMNILFLTLSEFWSIEERGIYTDLIREFVRNNHKMYIISPYSKSEQGSPIVINEKENYKILKLSVGSSQNNNLFKKGISTLTLESKFINAIKKHFSNVKFDLIIYSTPPITLQRAVQYVKKRDNAKAYLLLKDIFPQNAVDLGMLKMNGLIYSYFSAKEKSLYKQADYIGCMSPANVDFILKHNPEIATDIIEVCPNSLEPSPFLTDYMKKVKIRDKYRIPQNKTVFIYGGNLGKPQGIDFLIKCLKANKANNQAYFVIVGAGTEFNLIKEYFDHEQPVNAQLFERLPKDDYEVLVNSCDVGLIFLDHRFTIPNFPSRLLSYMQASMPVLAATDSNTDIGQIIEENSFGYWCESTDVKQFTTKLNQLCDKEIRRVMGKNARDYLENNYTSKHSYEIIMKHFESAEKREEIV